MELSNSEAQLIQVLREVKDVRLTLDQDDTMWHIRIDDWRDGIVMHGKGPSFNRAWRRTKAPDINIEVRF
jgi:hypothetical protein